MGPIDHLREALAVEVFGALGATEGLGHVGLAHHGGRPSVRTVGRGDTLAVQGLGDLGEVLAFLEQRPDLGPP